MLSPKKTKFRKQFKGRIHGASKGGTLLNFGSYGLKAVEPERKARPHRATIVVLSTLGAFFFAIMWAFIAEARSKVLASEQGALKWQELKSHLRFKRS